VLLFGSDCRLLFFLFLPFSAPRFKNVIVSL
jgi:hypothetical protein